MRLVYWLGVFIPVALALRFANAAPSLIFVASAVGVVPTAALMGEATEQLGCACRSRHRGLGERHFWQRA